MPGPGGHGGGGFGGHGGGFGGHGGGFGGRGGGWGRHHGHGWGGPRGGPGFWGPGPFLPGFGPGFGPGPRFGHGPLWAPWLGALTVTAVAGAAVASYPGPRPYVVYQEGGRQVETAVNTLVVTVVSASGIREMQMLGKQDPYVRGILMVNGRKVSTCESMEHRNGGREPSWGGARNAVFTFYVPATVTLNQMTITLELHNKNWVSDDLIGTTGQIHLHEAADGQLRWWNITSGGVLQASIQLVTPDVGPQAQNSAPAAAATARPTATAPGYPGGPATQGQPPPQAVAYNPGGAPMAQAQAYVPEAQVVYQQQPVSGAAAGSAGLPPAESPQWAAAATPPPPGATGEAPPPGYYQVYEKR